MAEADATITPDAVYSRLPDIVPRRIAGDTILVPVRGELARLERIFVLDAVGEHIWEALDGQRTTWELLESVLACFDIDEATARADLGEFLADLGDAGLITPAPRRT